MRLLKDLLTLGGAACIGWAVPNLFASTLPFYDMGNFRTIGSNSLILAAGITFVVMGYGFQRRALFAWLLGCLFYAAVVGYFFWRVVTRLELNSYYVLLILIAEWPFAALWWRYAKLYFAEEEEE
jgi:hypothetical protein